MAWQHSIARALSRLKSRSVAPNTASADRVGTVIAALTASRVRLRVGRSRGAMKHTRSWRLLHQLAATRQRLTAPTPRAGTTPTPRAGTTYQGLTADDFIAWGADPHDAATALVDYEVRRRVVAIAIRHLRAIHRKDNSTWPNL